MAQVLLVVSKLRGELSFYGLLPTIEDEPLELMVSATSLTGKGKLSESGITLRSARSAE